LPGGITFDILERLLGPVDEVETVFVAPVFDHAVLVERVRIKTTAFDCQRVVHYQLRRHHRIDQCRVTALQRNRIAQTGQIDQCGLPENVVTYDACREPWEVQIALAFDELFQGRGQRCRVAAAHQIFRQYARGVRQFVVSAGCDCIDGGTRIEEIQ